MSKTKASSSKSKSADDSAQGIVKSIKAVESAGVKTQMKRASRNLPEIEEVQRYRVAGKEFASIKEAKDHLRVKLLRDEFSRCIAADHINTDLFAMDEVGLKTLSLMELPAFLAANASVIALVANEVKALTISV